MMRTTRKVLCTSLVTAALLVGFTFGLVGSATAASGKDYPDKTVTLVSLSAPGSGFDTTIRAIAATLTKEKLVPARVALPVINMAGSAQGTLAIVTKYKNDPYAISVNSIAGMMNYATGMSPYSHKDAVPLALLISGYYGVFVKADSPYKTLGDLLKDLKTNPGGTPLSGGRSDDRVCYGALFMKAGVDVTKVNYAAYAGGTEAAPVVLEGAAKAEITTVDDIMGLVEAKQLRPLAVSSAKRLSGVFKDTPTFQEAGIDLVWSNFRYAFAPPGFPDYAKKYWIAVLTKMVKTPTWQDLCNKYRWDNSFMVDGVDKFLDEKQVIITDVMTKLGMAKK
jgi:putative tricarboxylic transport membrane protein